MNDDGTNIIVSQQRRDLVFGDWASAAIFVPRRVWIGEELLHHLLRCYFRAVLSEYRPEGCQQLYSDARLIWSAREVNRRPTCLLGPSLPRPAKEPPAGSDWIYEIKHEGFRILARRDETGVRLFTRDGYNFADRFPLIAEAVAALPVKSCFIDGEAIVVDSTGLSVFDLLRYRQHDGPAVLCAFDLIELDGKDLRPSPIERRKDQLGNLLHSVRRSHTGITYNEHHDGDGAIIYKHACRFGCEGIVSKRSATPTGPVGSTIGSRSKTRQHRR